LDIALQRQLLDGERILWSGRPAQGLLLQPIDTYLIPFSLLWCGFAVFWNLTAWRSGAPVFFQVWGLPFLAVGAYFVIGRFIHDAFLRRRQIYAVTNRRVLALTEGRSVRLRSFDIDQLPTVDMRERPDGSGTIRFGLQMPLPGRSSFGQLVPALDPRLQFLGIARVRDVYRLIQGHRE
jgi:hypothetical protein